MVNSLVWHDAKSFKRHLEQMRMFRLTHHDNLKSRFALLKDMPVSGGVHFPSKTGGTRGLISMRGKSTLIPVREIVLHENSQN
jgi:hypothetical protein